MKLVQSVTAAVLLSVGVAISGAGLAAAEDKEIVYITPTLNFAFWRNVGAGVKAAAEDAGYGFRQMESNDDAQVQLRNMQDAIASGAVGVVISPTDSSTAPSALKLAQDAGIPVSIADIGTTEGEYVTFVGSDNLGGAIGVGEAAAKVVSANGWEDGSFGIIGIPQARINGQLRTQGFREGLATSGMTKEVPLMQMQTFTAEETFRFSQDMIVANPDLRVIFVQSDFMSFGAQRAVKAARKTDEIIVAAFDGTPELLEAISKGNMVASGMQQPYRMGFVAAESLAKHIAGEATEKEVTIPILVTTTDNAVELTDEINLNVFAIEE